MPSGDEVSRFIRSTFRSVWSLEVLLLLKRAPRRWSASEIVSALRASDLVVAQSLEGLAAAGLILTDRPGEACYRPVSAEAAALADAAETLYRQSPDAVRRMIVSTSAGGLAAFADAFRLRKD